MIDKFYYSDGTTSSELDYRKTLHREDGPAIEYSDGGKEWRINGKPHRTNGPAIEWTNGDREWYINGKPHRTDGPAMEWANGSKAWYINGNGIGYYNVQTGKYHLYDDAVTEVTEEQARLLAAKHGVRI